MFRKTILSAVTVAALAGSIGAFTATTAQAGGYGYSFGFNNGYSHGYGKSFGYGKSIRITKVTWNRHLDWCHSHYKSFRPSDNTFQPFKGPRKVCISPFFKG